MKGKTVIDMKGVGEYEPFDESGIQRGPLKLPEGAVVKGELVAFGEDESFLHCVISGTGDYYGVFKSEDDNHLYQHLKALNT